MVFKHIKQVRKDRIAAAEADLLKVKASKRLVGAAYAKDQASKAQAKGDDDDEDDEVSSIVGRARERCTEFCEQPKKKKAKKSAEVVVDVDPWGLSSSEVRSDWTEMKSPPLMMFS